MSRIPGLTRAALILALSFPALPLSPAPAAMAQSISTQGPGDGCAPAMDGTVHPHCLTVMHDVATTGAAPEPTGWTAMDVSQAAPGATPLAVIEALMDMPFAEEGRPAQRIHLSATGYGEVDFRVTSSGWADDSTAGAEWVGRLVPRADGLWQLTQLDRRYLCSRGVSDGGLCL